MSLSPAFQFLEQALLVLLSYSVEEPENRLNEFVASCSFQKVKIATFVTKTDNN